MSLPSGSCSLICPWIAWLFPRAFHTRMSLHTTVELSAAKRCDAHYSATPCTSGGLPDLSTRRWVLGPLRIVAASKRIKVPCSLVRAVAIVVARRASEAQPFLYAKQPPTGLCYEVLQWRRPPDPTSCKVKLACRFLVVVVLDKDSSTAMSIAAADDYVKMELLRQQTSLC